MAASAHVRHSLKSKLIAAFLVLGLVPLAISGALAYRESYGELKSGAGKLLQTQATHAIDKIDRNLFERFGDVQAFAFHPNARGNTAEATLAADFYTVAYGIYDLMIISDPEGRVVASNTIDFHGNAIDPIKARGADVKAEAWHRACVDGTIKKGQSYFTEVVDSPLVAGVTGGNGATIVFSAPIFDANGQVVRVWTNFASPRRIIGEIMEQTREKLKSLGMTTVETEVVDSRGMTIDAADAARILKADLVAERGPAALRVVSGEEGFLIAEHPQRRVETVDAYAHSVGALGFKGSGFGVILRQDLSEAVASSGQFAMFTALTALISGLVIVAAAFVFAGRMVKPIREGVTIMEELAEGEGDLTRRLAVRTEDELGQLAIQFNRFMDKMHAVIAAVKTSVVGVNTISTKLATTSDSLASGSHQQASGLEETAASCEELSGTVTSNAENAKQATALAGESQQIADSGGAVVQSAVAAMSSIRESSAKIGDILATIDEIAFQTNMLALNAAVEAARAGDQGRGFAVVASEVRQLAQRSAAAAREIKDLVAESQRRVSDGTDLVNRSGDTLGNIVVSTKRVTAMISEIARASEEQAQGIRQVTSAVSDMDHLTQKCSEDAAMLSGAAQELTGQTRSLEDLVARFRT